jgi:hypothetical protein
MTARAAHPNRPEVVLLDFEEEASGKAYERRMTGFVFLAA